jgi:hypothetical protein
MVFTAFLWSSPLHSQTAGYKKFLACRSTFMDIKKSARNPRSTRCFLLSKHRDHSSLQVGPIVSPPTQQKPLGLTLQTLPLSHLFPYLHSIRCAFLPTNFSFPLILALVTFGLSSTKAATSNAAFFSPILSFFFFFLNQSIKLDTTTDKSVSQLPQGP